MSALLLTGWLLAVGAGVLLLLARRAARRSTERVVRACHELRGPLQNVMLALGAAEAAAPPGDGRTVRGPGTRHDGRLDHFPGATPLSALAQELTRAVRAVDDLGRAHGRPGRDERRPVDLVPLVRDLVAVHDLAARGRGRRVVLHTAGTSPTVLGDRARLVQAIGNLVQNAMEHGEGVVRVGVGAQDGRVHVEVADEGQGLRVPIELLVRGRRRGQRGRGMRIVSDALAAHGGRLRSAPAARGARLVAELPAAPRTAVR